MPDLHPSFLEIPIAHRGLHDPAKGCFENSPGAIRAAMTAGYGIEMDIQEASCGEPMVFHDGLLDRMTDQKGWVKDRSVTELKKIRLGNSNDTIPTFEDVLETVAGKVPVLIELKQPLPDLERRTGTVEARVAELLQKYHGPAAVMSFNPHAVAEIRNADPRIVRGLVTCNFTGADWHLISSERVRALAAVEDFERVGASFVSHNKKQLDNPAVAALRKRNVPVLCWTITSETQEIRARAVADNITFEGYPAKHRTSH